MTTFLTILSLIGGMFFLTLTLYCIFLFLWFLRDLIDDIFHRDEHSIEMMREIVKGGEHKSIAKNIMFGQCSKNHDRIKSGIYALVNKKTGKIKIKTCSRPDDGLIASRTTDA